MVCAAVNQRLAEVVETSQERRGFLGELWGTIEEVCAAEGVEGGGGGC